MNLNSRSTEAAFCNARAPRGLGLLVLAALLLSGCASSVITRPGVVMENIHREIAAAATPMAKAEPPAAVQSDLLPPLQMESPKKGGGEARFDISVANAPAAQVFMAIVEGTPYSMLVPPEVTGTLTLSLKSVTVREVLETIRDLYGYEFRLEDNRIFIQANVIQTRMYSVNYLAGQRRGSSNMSLTSTSITSTGSSGNAAVPNVAGAAQPAGAAAGGNSGGASITTTNDSDFWRDIRAALASIVGVAPDARCSETQRCVVINSSSGVIVVRALPRELAEVTRYLRTTQLVVERQVMLEAKIINVTLSDQYQAGVNWTGFGGSNNRYLLGSQSSSSTLVGPGGRSVQTSAGLTEPLDLRLQSGGASALPGKNVGNLVTGLAQGFYGLAFQAANFAAMLNFLESQGSLQILSSPRVATLNNQKAVLKVGNDEFFVTNVSTTTTSGTGATTTSPTVTLQPFFSGIALDVTPQIDEGDQIILHIHPTISSVSEKTKTIDLGSGGQLILPLAASAVNESDSIVRVRDGNIVAIGGLMRQEQSGDRSGLPGTSQQEFTLLGQRGRASSKQEVVILIKPTIIRDDADWREGLTETQSRLQEFAPAAPVRIQGN
ncbi:MAG: secretin N-terminal domain-containing protein [Rhodocyclaceae bacterium]|jgi:MSHA biogenesis protein MshL|nr:secretin N-terminal domain-containing protein [Rhodocyclaceae bacterium]